MLRLAGTWAPQHRARILYDVYSAILMVTFILGCLTCVFEAFRLGYRPVSSQILCLMGPCFSCVGKRGSMRRLLADLEAMPRPPTGSEGAKALARAMREGNTVSFVYLATGLVALFLWILMPIVHGNKAASKACRQRLLDAGANVTADDCQVRVLPSDAWFPFELTRGYNYEYAYAFEVQWCVGMFINQTMMVCLHVCMMLHVAAHGNALAERMRTTSEVDELHACVRHHQQFIQCVKGLQTVLGPGILVQYLCSLGVICLSLYNLSKVNAIVLGISYLSFFLTMSWEVLILCWYGEGVTSSGEEVARAVYECPWPDAPLRMRTELITVIMRSQPNLYIRTAGGFKTLQRETFLSLMQTSYSLYTLLVTMDE